MTDETRSVEGCPAAHDLSAAHDRQPEAGAGKTHAAACPTCGAVLDIYRRLDVAVAAAVQPPPGLAERIKRACHPAAAPPRDGRFQGRLHPARPRLILLPRLLRSAAAVAVFGFIGWLAWDAARPVVPAPAAPGVAFGRPEALLEGPATAEPFAVEEARLAAAGPAPLAEGLPPQPLRLVNLGGGSLPAASVGDAGVSRLPRRIHHVWVVEKPAEAAARLEAVLPAGARLERIPGVSRDLFRIRLADREVQTLVDALSRNGFSLVSPGLPQPGEARRLAITGRPVAYDIELVGDAPR